MEKVKENLIYCLELLLEDVKNCDEVKDFCIEIDNGIISQVKDIRDMSFHDGWKDVKLTISYFKGVL